MIECYRLLIGSIGDDSHSVGMALLEIAFKESGFIVKNIGILNTLEDFFRAAPGYDAVLISCMNGHVDLYLDEFPFWKKRFDQANPGPRLWYLGGNLSVKEEAETIMERYRRCGFDFVSPRPISCDAVKERLYRDFYRKGIRMRKLALQEETPFPPIPRVESVTDEPLPGPVFHAIRREVLDSWPSGAEVWDEDIARNHSTPTKNFHHVLSNRHGKENSRPLVQPRTGVAHTGDEIDILLFLRQGGLDISSIQLDAASRKKMYNKAQEGVLKTEKGGTSFLNGYPVPVHGVKGVKEILQAIDTPFQVRAGSPDHRLVYEIALAGGATSVEGGFICYLFPYDKRTSPVESLEYWKYIDQLTAWYHQVYGVIINREYFGPLTCCLIEPSIAITINIIQALLSARMGVTSISVGLAEQGNRAQDIAAIRILARLTHQYLETYGYSHCTVTTVFHHYMAAFPTDMVKAEDLILNSSITASLAKADRIMTKTPVEAHHIPTREDNSRGLWLTHRGLMMARDKSCDEIAVQAEMILLEKEVTALVSSIETLGKGALARGAIKAFELGFLDIPFSPSLFNRNISITARDCNGAVRFVNPDHLPFTTDIIETHKEKIHQRLTAERTNRVSLILEKDLTRIWKNDFAHWPLDNTYIY